MRRHFYGVLFGLAAVLLTDAQVKKMVFVSDLHYGIYRPHFRGSDSVASYIVNAAQVAAIKRLGSVDAIAITGDIANRQEEGIQPASVSWKQFLHDYKNFSPKIFIVPGNHDVSNAIGHPKIPDSVHDASAVAGIFNIEETRQITAQSYHHHTDKVNYSSNIDGVHCLFLDIWPDSSNRIWMEKDLSHINSHTPVLIFAHDPPTGDMKHFTRPSAQADGIAAVKFENVLDEVYKDSTAGSTELEQNGFIAFLLKHPNIKGYFHGHENFSEMYDYHGLPVFRADSPMKGEISRKDETALSFQLVTFDNQHHKLIVTEYFWNRNKTAGDLIIGKSRTVPL